ncbi:MAG: hypothetical protein IT373_10100 [Polyangiaceae bacterium]|nr:hypothetical protein [Polyangiaceae bacterium]
MSLRCIHCELALEPEAERCPRCLRKSGLVDADAPRRERRPRLEALEPGLEPGRNFGADAPAPPSHAGVRLVTLVGAWALAAPIMGLLFAAEPWLEAQGLWLAAIMGGFAVASLPLRAVFTAPPPDLDTRGAARHYALLSLGVQAMGLVLFGAMALATTFVTSPIVGLFVGLAIFLVLVLCGPIAFAAVRGRHPAGPALRAIGKNAVIAIAIVVVGAGLVLLRAASRTESSARPTIPVFLGDPKKVLDPLDVGSVEVRTRRVTDADGFVTVHLSADGGSFDRTMVRLLGAALGAADAAKKDPRASGELRLWMPARLRDSDAEATLRTEESALNDALRGTGARTAGGRPIHVSCGFGAPPGG